MNKFELKLGLLISECTPTSRSYFCGVQKSTEYV